MARACGTGHATTGALGRGAIMERKRSEQIRRWESGALAHAVTDPFGQGPVPWLRGNVTYFDDTGQVVPWYLDGQAHPPTPGTHRVPGPRSAGGPRSADDVHR